jgi:hypothetical protein
MFNSQTMTSLINNILTDTPAAAQDSMVRRHVLLKDGKFYYPPAEAVAVKVLEGTAWVGYGNCNIGLYRGEVLALDHRAGVVGLTNLDHRSVVIEVYFHSTAE